MSGRTVLKVLVGYEPEEPAVLIVAISLAAVTFLVAVSVDQLRMVCGFGGLIQIGAILSGAGGEVRALLIAGVVVVLSMIILVV